MSAIVIGIIILAVVLVVASIYRLSAAGKAKAARLCTKHVIRKSMVPGGPEQLVWSYGPHRTPGNQCDGPEHQRVSGWW